MTIGLLARKKGRRSRREKQRKRIEGSRKQRRERGRLTISSSLGSTGVWV